jgi:hypothetical protein
MQNCCKERIDEPHRRAHSRSHQPGSLDVIERSFKFSHGKGTAEWLKNSLDNYLRRHRNGVETMSGGWPVIVSLMDGDRSHVGPNLAVIDFGGTSYSNINEFFLHWGDSKAATHGGAAAAPVTGGHGNGGKFYMRGMWQGGARLTTWLGGRATSLIVDRTPGDNTIAGRWEIHNER